ncbi:MAG TPA: hypothetical protein VKT81_23220, partial [Bryobacteraceae bacterium]|nr:hypothetical protein [Bryobacteraceae bacterium]
MNIQAAKGRGRCASPACLVSMNNTPSIKAALVLLLCATALLLPAQTIALLKENDVLLINADGQTIAKLTRDNRPKTDLRWLPDGQHLSYLVRDNSGAKARLVLIDLAGNQTKEISIRPRTDPPTEGLRFIEDVSWMTQHKLRITGSINPRNCEMFDVDVDTAKESNWQVGYCGSFVASPDDNHIAHLGLVTQGADAERTDSLEIDNGSIVYRGTRPILVLAGPVWSQDSSQIAVLEKQVDSGELAVTTVSTAGQIDRVPVPQNFGENASLTFIAHNVAIRSAARSLLADTRQKTVGALAGEVATILAQADQDRQKSDQAKERIKAL